MRVMGKMRVMAAVVAAGLLLLAAGAGRGQVFRIVPLSDVPASPWWVVNPTGTNLTQADFNQTANTNWAAIQATLAGGLSVTQQVVLFSGTSITNALAWTNAYQSGLLVASGAYVAPGAAGSGMLGEDGGAMLGEDGGKMLGEN